MRFSDNDIRKDAPLYIRELQGYLRELSYIHPTIPRLEIDGIFGSRTAAAVKAAQVLFRLPEDGRADYPTWTVIVAAYRSVMQRKTPEPIDPFATSFRLLKEGDNGDTVQMVQIMFNALSRRYANFAFLDITGTMDAPTMQNIRTLQQISGLLVNGLMDVSTWNSLAKAYTACGMW